MTARRFTDKPDLDPTAVRELPPDHLAMVESRTLFPNTVVTVDENFEDRLLVSGRESRKLGETITKGQFKGYALYQLSLEERATCPADCEARSFCYGNGMQFGRRHRIVDEDFFFVLIEDEIREILSVEKHGLMVRLHVLGDFPSVSYVERWAKELASHPRLACFGYTHRKTHDDIGRAIAKVKARYPDRFRIRWSATKPAEDSAVITTRRPETARVAEGIVCPAQRDATACCASCALCWDKFARKETIVFVKHGPRSLEVAAQAEREEKSGEESPLRGIRPISLPSSIVPKPIVEQMPVVRMVKPKSLIVEAAYQRDLSGKSIKLIRRIVANWDWAKFKPPVCAGTADGLFVIDGQHTAIAAASHPGITGIPVMIVPARKLETRASAFVAHNRDRIAMTAAQVFYGEVAAGDVRTKRILDAVTRAGGTVPRLQVVKKHAKPGQFTAIAELRRLVGELPQATADKLLRIAVKSKHAPIPNTLIRGLRILLTDQTFSATASIPEDQLTAIVAEITDIDAASRARALVTGHSRDRACAFLIAEALAERGAAA